MNTINKVIGVIAIILSVLSLQTLALENISWPKNQRMAISLSYDDALSSQLDHALPALNKYGLKASFYPTLSSKAFISRLADWRQVAKDGHELGNHTVYHPCSASVANRDWVKPYYNLDNYKLAEIIDEINIANGFLMALDGQTERTYTAPCNDLKVSGENYLPHVESMFVAIKGHEQLPYGAAVLWAPDNVTAQKLIARIKQEADKGTQIFNILFHGVGGDHSAVSQQAHEEMLQYLASNLDIYYVDTYINIIKHSEKTGAKK
ncbi:polysaccharide deacetylase [Thalassotalea sp. HSM 43]|uniref:polysaccharide deacetylase family protein n=1 Tax=Thalassotalea sp. HSM 43 TaxID=2552945 RepID=UPI00108184CD|nr:polysaccharide deacetylase family protein [Thalassotalea sp. HSM 43]QBY04382.1 polysaccharide deacetylase [Thalassotalea sp. HSM 43]